MALSTNAVKGLSALHMCRDLGVPYKTAFVLMPQRRERLMAPRGKTPLSGEVEVEGASVSRSARRTRRKTGSIGD